MESWRAAGHRQCYRDWGGREKPERGQTEGGGRGPRKEGVRRGEEFRGAAAGVGDGLRILGSVVRETACE